MYTADKKRERILILVAAGRDFHNFNVFFRSRAPVRGGGIHCRSDTGYCLPPLSARAQRRAHPAGLPIWPEDALEEIIIKCRVDRCILSYSDLSHEDVMHLAEDTGHGHRLRIPGRTESLCSSQRS